MDDTKPRDIGRNEQAVRNALMKRDVVALAMGVSQQTISTMENSETLDDHKLYGKGAWG